MNAVAYRAGEPVAENLTLEEVRSDFSSGEGLVWVSLLDPSDQEFSDVAQTFGISEYAIEDAMSLHHRSKLKRYGETLFTTLQAARYVEDRDEVEFSELHVFLGAGSVVSVRHSEIPNVARVRRVLERTPGELALGPEAVLYALIRQVLEEYAPVIAGLEHDVDEIEDHLFAGDISVARRIFDLSREVIALQRATHPLDTILRGLQAGYEKFHVDPELAYELEELQGFARRTIEQVDALRFVLQSALMVHATLADQQESSEMRRLAEIGFEQNEEVKKISAWAAILFAPSLIAGIYGMNFHNIPLLENRWGFVASMGMMVAFSLGLYGVFKRKHWL